MSEWFPSVLSVQKNHVEPNPTSSVTSSWVCFDKVHSARLGHRAADVGRIDALLKRAYKWSFLKMLLLSMNS